jgi:hypothetical protein
MQPFAERGNRCRSVWRYREMRTGKTAMGDGAKLIYSLRCMRDVLETVVLERIESRLEQLEGMSPHGHTTSDPPTIRAH